MDLSGDRSMPLLLSRSNMFFHVSTYAAFRQDSLDDTIKDLKSAGWKVDSDGMAVPTRPKVLVVTENDETYKELGTTMAFARSKVSTDYILNSMIIYLYTSVLVYKTPTLALDTVIRNQFYVGDILPRTNYPYTVGTARNKEWFEGVSTVLGIDVQTKDCGPQSYLVSKTEYKDHKSDSVDYAFRQAFLGGHGVIVCETMERCAMLAASAPPFAIRLRKDASTHWRTVEGSAFHTNWDLKTDSVKN